MILLREVTRIIVFHHYIKYMRHQPDFSLKIQDYGTITDESFSDFRSAGALDFVTLFQSLLAPITTFNMLPTQKKNTVDEFHKARSEPAIDSTNSKSSSNGIAVPKSRRRRSEWKMCWTQNTSRLQQKKSHFLTHRKTLWVLIGKYLHKYFWITTCLLYCTYYVC